jgi:hypothetical protein
MTDDITVPADAERARKVTVTVVYNGLERKIAFQPDTTVGTIREEAVREFGITQNPHLLGLFTKDGNELNDGQTAREAGLHNRTILLLRPSTVRGGR